MSIFENCTFFVSTDVKSKSQLTKTIKENGGNINFLVTKQCTHFVTVEREFNNQTTNIKKANTMGIHIINEHYVTDCVSTSKRLDEQPYKFLLKPHIKLFDSQVSSSVYTAPSPKKVEPIAPIELPKVFAPKPKAAVAKPSSYSFSGTAATPSTTTGSTTSTTAFGRRKIIDSEDFGLDPQDQFTLPVFNPTTTATSTSLFGAAPTSTSIFGKPAAVAQTVSTATSALSEFQFLNINDNNSTNNKTLSYEVMIPNPRTIKCELFTFGSPKEPQFPTNYKTIKTHTLQFTNIGNNNNKYYILELHEGTNPNGSVVYRLYTNYGRTSGKATKETRYPRNFDDALNLYCLIYNEKTSDKKGYKPVSLNAAKITSTSDQAAASNNANTPSNLPEEIQSLVKTLFAEATTHLTNSCSANITENGIETPLGVLSMEQVEKGEKILDKLHVELKTSRPLETRLAQLSSEFYTVIPHKMGRTKADIDRAVIRNLDQLSAKVDLLQLMKDLLKINQSGGLSGSSAIDMKYHSLKSEITSLHSYSTEYETVSRLVSDSQGDYPVQISNIYKINRQTEASSFNQSITPTKLLFHGSRPANFVGILSRGMLMPKVIVNNGGSRTDFGFLGAGIYFADKFSTSCLYAAPTAVELESSKPSRFILVSEVALGMTNKLTKIDSTLTKPPTGYQSCLGVANNGYNQSDFKDNEYVIYNTNQQKQQYLVQFTLGDGGNFTVPTAKAEPVAHKPANTSTIVSKYGSVYQPPATATLTNHKVPTPVSTPIAATPVAAAKTATTTTTQVLKTKIQSKKEFEEFPEETKYREMFASSYNVNKDKFLGLENVFDDANYKNKSPLDLSSEFVVMPFVRDQIYATSNSRITDNYGQFQINWHKFSNGMFDHDFDWRNVFVAGGAILKNSLFIPSQFEQKWADSDIDIFLYDLTEAEATDRLVKLYHYFKAKSPSMDVIRTKYAVTFVNPKPSRNIQVVLRIYRSPAEVLMGFDIDCCSIGFDGQNVYALPRARRAIVNGINCISMTRRSLTYESRLFKYAKRGFGILVSEYSRAHISKQIYSKPFEQSTGLARLLQLENRYVNSFNGHVPQDDKSDYDNIEIPYAGYSVHSLINIINYKDKSQFFGKKLSEFRHRHIAVTGFETAMQGKASWCKKCMAGDLPTGGGPDGGEYVHGPITWVTQNPGRQLLTGSFHPVNDEQWASSALSTTQPEPLTISTRYDAIRDNPIVLPANYFASLPKTKKIYNPVVAETNNVLHIACAYGSLETVKSIIPQIRTQINIPCDMGFYPIHYACIRGSVDLVKLLISHGAIPMLRSKNYQKFNCLIIAQYYKNQSVATYLQQNYPILARLKCKVLGHFKKWRFATDPNISTSLANTSIFSAILNGQPNDVERYLAEPNCVLTDAIGNTLYHYAAVSYQPAMMIAALDKHFKANRKITPEQENIYGQSARYFATMVMCSLTPIAYHSSYLLTSSSVMRDLPQFANPKQVQIRGLYSSIPIRFLNLPYHQASSLLNTSIKPASAAGGSPPSTPSFAKPAPAFGVGGKFSPSTNNSSTIGSVNLFGSTSPNKRDHQSPPSFNSSSFGQPSSPQPFSFGTSSAAGYGFGSPTAQPFGITNSGFGTTTSGFGFGSPTAQTFGTTPSGFGFGSPQPASGGMFGVPSNQLPAFTFSPPTANIFGAPITPPSAAAKKTPSPLQVPSTQSSEYPDFLLPGCQQFDQSSQVAKALVLITAVKKRFNDSDVHKLRLKAITLEMSIFNCIEAYQLDKDMDALVESFKLCLSL
ncbi:hypothetical protein PPL_05938 [Heterostelium album PN500]|uniref:Poly [ADP-ribose] polymerase n=1 Tax=Heterostelium pallidum (strain ATCC 26659 / Pp 5 / PN500) TaxID=670386 RepID=D3BBR9_HETP5|nr:hypothetical protein PPL_05938 [Heterostelium album PN500]EFA81102.1 hypothetical protein PPL_05938 [Heterostelium album PN500]|eukprot:XP_020433220.1 hypothetical protein PPL_05938 [Heterostelium album PN500]